MDTHPPSSDLLPRSRAATIGDGESLDAFLRREKLFTIGDQGIARLPVLISGQLVVPGVPADAVVEDARARGLSEFDCGETHCIVVEAAIGQQRLRCLALPRVTDPAKLIPNRIADQIRTLHPLGFDRIAAYIDAVGAALSPESSVVREALPLAVACSNQPEAFVRLGFSDVRAAFNGAAVSAAVDRELSYDGRPGRNFLDDWVEIGDEMKPGAMAKARADLGGGPSPSNPVKRRVRAFPTSQLHITAGNAPVVAAISALRALATKGSMTIKLPSGALVAGTAFALALWAIEPSHPLIRDASIAYWRGGDKLVEEHLFRAGAFGRIVVWGSREAVDAVASRAAGTKTLVFNPRYGVSLVGSGALQMSNIGDTVRRAAQDTMVWNQQACIASLVHYVEGSDEEVDRYCSLLRTELSLWDGAHAHRPDRATIGRIRTARRGELSDGKWLVNGPPVAPTSGVVRMDHGFDLASHPQARIVVVRRVIDLASTLDLLHSAVSSVGVWPMQRLGGLRDAICGRGVTAVLPLGEADTLFAGSPHDGLRALSELVSWCTA